MASARLQNAFKRLVPILASISVEPVFLLDGFAFSNMVVLVESLQFDKICKINLNYTDEICNNFEKFPEEEHAYNVKVSDFKRNDGAISSIIPIFFILFIGAWSDKYGRKVPLCLTLFCHILYSGGYLINAWFFELSVDFLLAVGFLDSIGGGAVAFLTVSNAYISDVTTTEQRTSRVALANSLWFLGGPLGTLIGTVIFKRAGYAAVFITSLVLYVIAFAYVAFLLPESHGPFSDKKRLKKISKPKPTVRLRDTIIRVYGLSKRKKSKLGKTESEEDREIRDSITWKRMFLDFFDIRRVLNSFKCVFRKRDGFTRLFIFLIIFSSFLRKIGRGAYSFYFTREVLKWDAADYGYWSTYKNFLSTLGSLFAVPILSTRLKTTDNTLAMIGSVSSIMDYILYGLVTPEAFYLMWIAPATSVLVNSCSIAMRAMMSKYVNADELGQVSAVTGTMEGVVPIISTSLYSAITRSTFETFPGAQFFFGAACNIVMALIFVFIMTLDKTDDYNLETAKPKQPKGPVRERAIVIRKDSNWLFDEQNNNKIRLSTILLSGLNFSIEVPSIERVYSKNTKKLSTIAEDIETIEDGVNTEPMEEENSNSTRRVQDSVDGRTVPIQENGRYNRSEGKPIKANGSSSLNGTVKSTRMSEHSHSAEERTPSLQEKECGNPSEVKIQPVKEKECDNPSEEKTKPLQEKECDNPSKEKTKPLQEKEYGNLSEEKIQPLQEKERDNPSEEKTKPLQEKERDNPSEEKTKPLQEKECDDPSEEKIPLQEKECDNPSEEKTKLQEKKCVNPSEEKTEPLQEKECDNPSEEKTKPIQVNIHSNLDSEIAKSKQNECAPAEENTEPFQEKGCSNPSDALDSAQENISLPPAENTRKSTQENDESNPVEETPNSIRIPSHCSTNDNQCLNPSSEEVTKHTKENSIEQVEINPDKATTKLDDKAYTNEGFQAEEHH